MKMINFAKLFKTEITVHILNMNVKLLSSIGLNMIHVGTQNKYFKKSQILANYRHDYLNLCSRNYNIINIHT